MDFIESIIFWNFSPQYLFMFRRMTERETVPNEYNWRQELFIIDRKVKIRNRIGMADLERWRL